MSEHFEAAREAFLQGLASQHAGRLDDAEAHYRQALALLPGRPSALTNLGATLVAAGRAEEALPLLEQALQAEPGNAEALSHRGLALARTGRDDDALAVFAALCRLQPGLLPAWLHRADVATRLGRFDEAVTALEQALALQPQLGPAWSRYGAVLKDMGRTEAAMRALQRAVALGDEVQANRYLLAALGHGEAPAQAPAHYVQRLFDAYAGDFDRHLVHGLYYQAHRQLASCLQADGRRFESALDLGCGTGLCGPLLRPMVRQLQGVDLSPRMLAQARALGCYDRLHAAEITQHLQHSNDTHDLVVATDVFIYIGDLAPVFAGVRRVLRPGGLFAFSVEHAAGPVAWELRPSARYAHAEPALRGWAAEQGLQVAWMHAAPLREDQRRPVPGLYLGLQAA